MKPSINKNLITLKCVLFCFLSGIGCIFPFLPLHMLAVGLDKSEARLISVVAPCVALLGPAILGPLLDKLSVGRGSTGTGPSGSGKLLRMLTAACLILCAIFYLLLLAVPYTERHEARRPQVLFMCDEEGAYVMQGVCNQGSRCNHWDGEKKGVLALTACEYGCADTNMTWITKPFPTTTTTTTMRQIYQTAKSPSAVEEEDVDYPMDFEINPPHLCTDGQCFVYMQHASRLRLPLTLLAPEQGRDNETEDASEDMWCTYRTAGQTKCRVPPQRLNEIKKDNKECRPAVRCQVLDPYDESDSVLADSYCKLIIGDHTQTFWSYFIVRILSDIWPTAALALLGAACVIATRETSLGRGDVGRQWAVGTVGVAIFPPLAGLAAQAVPDNPYLVPFIMNAVFMIIGASILLIDSNMPLVTPEWWWHTSSGVLALPLSAVRRYGAETASVFLVVLLLGVLASAIDAYLPWMMVDMNADDTLVGLTLTIGAIPAVLALWWAETLVDYVGHSNIFIASFAFYCLRFTGLGYTMNNTWIFVSEFFEVFTMSLVWVTAVLYFRHLVPRKYTATGQALPVIAHFCLGRCIGAIIGGLLTWSTELDSAKAVYRGLGVASMLIALVYLGVYHLILVPRCHAPSAPPPRALLEGLSGNGNSNGTYSPMRVYHEERSRKGQFRY